MSEMGYDYQRGTQPVRVVDKPTTEKVVEQVVRTLGNLPERLTRDQALDIVIAVIGGCGNSDFDEVKEHLDHFLICGVRLKFRDRIGTD